MAWYKWTRLDLQTFSGAFPLNRARLFDDLLVPVNRSRLSIGLTSQTQTRLKIAMEKNQGLKTQVEELRKSLEEERKLRPASDTRAELLTNLAALKKRRATLEDELSAYGNSDPVKVEQLKRAEFLAKEAAMRWTDNYCSTLSHFVRQTGVDVEDVRKYLDIGEDYEDIY
ncbi:hypothetical protein D9611_003900 [Ephemerocybe angulata]|uniref:Leucine zipper with capping helix domain-containing protein n=1 Tax=Ephemerocybe angulata TaxID=980116 RepID=A0A8H5EYQ0_9AGAR|nr:hypothetical protein D9611_003900 [Tulosesus angulatus]